MKHLRIFLENKDIPADVYSDIEEFKKELNSQFNNLRKYYQNVIQKKFDKLMDDFPTMEDSENMNIYCIQDKEDQFIGYSNGLNELHALLRLAIVKKDVYLLTYENEYFYIYKEENIEDIRNHIKSIENDIKRQKDILKFYQDII